MKKINDLKIERTSLITEMDEVIKRSETAKMSDEDQTKWNENNSRVEEIDAEIERLERQLELNKRTAQSKEPEEKKIEKRFDLGKAILEARKGHLTGLEAEMHQEAENELRGLNGVVGNLYIPSMLIKRANEETKTTGASAGHIKTDVGGLGVVVPDPLYKKFGATVFENLPPGILDLPFSQGHTAAKVAEEGTASQSVPTDSKGTLTPARFQGWQKFTQEYLSASALMNQVTADMIAAVERGIGNALVDDAVAANVMTGYATSDTAAALTWSVVLSMLAELDGDQFVNEGFVMSKEVFYKLAATVRASSTDSRMILDLLTGANEGKITGIPAFGTGFLAVHDTNKYDIIYGDMKQTFVGTWGGVQILVDPYSASDDGYVKITFSRMAAVDTNPYAVASIRNVTVA